MTYREMLGKVELNQALITNKIRFIIKGKDKQGYPIAKEHRDLTQQEIYAYTMLLIKYLVEEEKVDELTCSNGMKVTFTYNDKESRDEQEE